MKRRCAVLDRYTRRGITYDGRWINFRAFVADMGLRPKGTTLERKDNEKGYSKANCCWATMKQQCRNKSNTKWFNYKGQQVLIADLAQQTGLHRTTLTWRINSGLTVEQAVALPIAYGGRRQRGQRILA